MFLQRFVSKAEEALKSGESNGNGYTIRLTIALNYRDVLDHTTKYYTSSYAP